MAQFLNTLHDEHEMVKGLFQKIEAADTDPAKEKLFSQLRHELMPHMKGEEKYFYPALKEKKDYKEDVLEAVEEHHAARLILNELEDMSPDEDHWDAKLSVLKEMIEHHIEEEEEKIFKEAREALSEERMKKIAESFESEKSRV